MRSFAEKALGSCTYTAQLRFCIRLGLALCKLLVQFSLLERTLFGHIWVSNMRTFYFVACRGRKSVHKLVDLHGFVNLVALVIAMQGICEGVNIIYQLTES